MIKIKNLFLVTDKKISLSKFLINIFILGIIIFSVGYFSFKKIGLTLDFSFLILLKSRLIKGFLMTFYISLGSFILSSLIGIITVLFQKSNIIILKYISLLYVKFIRGTPLIMQIYLFFYIIGTAWGIENRFIAGIIILSTFEGAYISEILRGSLDSIDKSQLEIGKSVGFTKKQTFKFVIFPQLMARTMPALTGQFASIVKDSSLLSIIAIIELTQTMREISATNFKLFESYMALGLLYLVFTLPLSYISEKLERRFKYES
ncbi:amino acid ABC transporter permease [Fusobacterium perfoetens]|uniref:amino acid ABC transporter permease n=1 Tax=Fusobacterium perfoetens TaxID=852 RepID=UPI000685444C|nr:amino acid ABC transporter permease [Fusobacterium perfoetens]MCI6152774.1 amino acid ABC transporter permease [Fusobacterium perfoetens]MDY3236668.1 amino acid ABC transporter permease [Fusobacterium perfoetens]